LRPETRRRRAGGRSTRSAPAAKAGSSASLVQEIGEARRAIDERPHAHEPVVAARGAPDAICLPGRTAIRPSRRSAAASVNARSGRKQRLRARPAYLPTCAVLGRDLQRQQYVDSRHLLPIRCAVGSCPSACEPSARLRYDIFHSPHYQEASCGEAQRDPAVTWRRRQR